MNLRWFCACAGDTSLAGEVTTRSPFFLSSVCPDILFVGVCNDVDYLMLNVIVEFGLGVRVSESVVIRITKIKLYIKIHEDYRTSRVRQQFRQGFRIPPGFVGFVVYAWLRFHSRGRFNLASPAISSFFGLVCSTRFVANDGFATTVSSLVGFSRVTKLRNVTYCALRVSSLFAYRGIGYDWNSEDWHR